ncbi:MAG: major facilitator superfamily 1 [Chitinophagaceae bacterium]|nr:major facilitator superfamily 1 [Chitinophagaceae bacterium]
MNYNRIAFLVLPIRGVLYTLSYNPYYLISIQVLDAIGGSISGIMQIMIVADITKGTGRFNLMQGMLATALGIGTALSNLLSGYLIQQAGFDIGFYTLSAIAVVALLFFYIAMPETKKNLAFQLFHHLIYSHYEKSTLHFFTYHFKLIHDPCLVWASGI